jgi:hypothetical protein
MLAQEWTGHGITFKAVFPRVFQMPMVGDTNKYHSCWGPEQDNANAWSSA